MDKPLFNVLKLSLNAKAFDPKTANLLEIAYTLSKTNPKLASEMLRSVMSLSRSETASNSVHTSVINPNVRKFEDYVSGMVTVLKSLSQELKQALTELDTDDSKEFNKFFEDVVEAEKEELQRMLKKTNMLKSASRIARIYKNAGPMDFFKNMFKKKPVEDDYSGIQPSYSLDDDSMDSFVEGKKDWSDPGHYIEQEMKENKEFFSGVDSVLKEMDKARKDPSKSLVTKIIETVDGLIKHGQDLLKGVRKHLKSDGSDSKEESKPEVKKTPKFDLESTVGHYADMLKESSGNEAQTLKFLKELFSKVGPLIEDEKATLAAKKILPVLIRSAQSSTKSRPFLLKVIKRIASSM